MSGPHTHFCSKWRINQPVYCTVMKMERPEGLVKTKILKEGRSHWPIISPGHSHKIKPLISLLPSLVPLPSPHLALALASSTSWRNGCYLMSLFIVIKSSQQIDKRMDACIQWTLSELIEMWVEDRMFPLSVTEFSFIPSPFKDVAQTWCRYWTSEQPREQ